MKSLFHELQGHIPHLPATRKVPRIKLLRLATTYIAHLSAVLNGHPDSSPQQGTLEQVVRKEVVRNNSYKDRAAKEMKKVSSTVVALLSGRQPPPPPRKTRRTAAEEVELGERVRRKGGGGGGEGMGGGGGCVQQRIHSGFFSELSFWCHSSKTSCNFHGIPAAL